MPELNQQKSKPPTRIAELASLFLKLGIIGFGGPAAHIAMMEDEVVRKRHWLTHEEFLDLVGATNLIPGPNSTEMAIHIGHRRAGWPGLIVAGACFILPAGLIVTAIAWAYVRFGSLPQVGGLLYGVKPVIIAIVAHALWRLGWAALRTWLLTIVGIASFVAAFLGLNELAVLGAAGLVTAVSRVASAGPTKVVPGVFPFGGAIPAGLLASIPATAPFSLGSLFLFFLKVGSVLFGSGYVLLAFLRSGLVERWHWITEQQLLDAIAVGQVTPGPVFTTATFIGYVLSGGAGAIIATVGIFLPAFVFVAISGPLVARLRRSALAGAFLDGVNVGSLALMGVVTWQLGRAALPDWLTVALAVITGAVLFRFKLNSAWLVGAGAIVGLVKVV